MYRRIKHHTNGTTLQLKITPFNPNNSSFHLLEVNSESTSLFSPTLLPPPVAEWLTLYPIGDIEFDHVIQMSLIGSNKLRFIVTVCLIKCITKVVFFCCCCRSNIWKWSPKVKRERKLKDLDMTKQLGWEKCEEKKKRGFFWYLGSLPGQWTPAGKSNN